MSWQDCFVRHFVHRWHLFSIDLNPMRQVQDHAKWSTLVGNAAISEIFRFSGGDAFDVIPVHQLTETLF
jgi:hypothetical protein